MNRTIPTTPPLSYPPLYLRNKDLTLRHQRMRLMPATQKEAKMVKSHTDERLRHLSYDFRSEATFRKISHQKKRADATYRTDVLLMRLLYLTGTVVESFAQIATRILPILGATSQTVYIGLLSHHSILRPPSPNQRFFQKIEALQLLAGIGTTASLIAKSIGNSLISSLLPIFSIVTLSLGFVKGTVEVYHKSRRLHHVNTYLRKSKKFSCNPKRKLAKQYIDLFHRALAVKQSRLTLKVCAYSLMTLGQGIALVGIFTGPILILAGICIALIGAGLRMMTTHHDNILEKKQKNAAIAIKECQQIINNSDIKSKVQMRSKLFRTFYRLPKKERQSFIRRWHQGESPFLIIDEIGKVSLKILGCSPSYHWDAIEAPHFFAREMVSLLSQDSPDAEELLRYLNQVMNTEKFYSSDNSFNKQACLEELMKALPRGRHLIERMNNYQKQGNTKNKKFWHMTLNAPKR